MILRNRELQREFGVYLLLLAAAAAAAFARGTGYGLLTLAIGGGLLALFYFFTYLRYRKIKALGLDMDRLLHNGTPLPIEKYTEGELSVLSTQIQKMTLRLQEAASMTQAEKDLLSDSLADISHQLRTPLTAMNLTAAMLSAADLSQDRRLELTRELRRQLSRTEWLVETLLKMSKLDAGSVTMARDRVEVRQAALRASEPLTIPMELREQRLILDCGDACFTGDAAWMAEALGNLLKNAMEHTPDGGTIRVFAEETPLFTRIVVSDTGTGFCPEDIPHLFERFYKGKNASQESFGIGLALARAVITAQNGTIQAANTPDGAAFTITLYKQII